LSSNTPRSNSSAGPSRLSSTLLGYGIALLTIVGGLLLTRWLALPTADAGPVLMVAIAVSALYSGLGPGILGLGLAALITRDPVVLVAGGALLALCTIFRRPRAAPSRAGETSAVESMPEPVHRFERLEPTPAGFSPEIPRVTPAFAEVTTEATWRFQHEQPLDITLPEDEQVEHLYLYSVLAECNDAFARMYGFRSAADVVGTRLVVFLPPSNPENVAYLRSFIRSGYRLEDAESHEIDRYGNAKYFVNNLVGIFERGQLVGAWGTQRDVTGFKRTDDPQESRSRIHSSKSSSQ
jgi:PAS domain-containing protein